MDGGTSVSSLCFWHRRREKSNMGAEGDVEKRDGKFSARGDQGRVT